MEDKVALIFTTFLRDELMEKTVKSVMDNWQDNYVLLIGDQNKFDNKDKAKNSYVNYLHCFHNDKLQYNYYRLPYDCGLSYARNYLVNKAHEMGIKYCLITADSIKFTDKYNFKPMIKMLESNPKHAIVGLNLKNRQPWAYDLEISPKHNKFIVIKPRRSTISANNIEYTPVDTVSNFFIAKTAILKEIGWDNELKLGEHEDFFIRLKQAGYKTFWTDSISAEYINDKPPEYDVMRKRLYGEFKDKLKKKYGLDPFGSWLIYNSKLPIDEQL